MGQLSGIHHVDLYESRCSIISPSAWSELETEQILPIRYSQPALPQRLSDARTNRTVDSDTDSDTGDCNSDSDSDSYGYSMTLSRMMNCAIKQDKHHWTICYEITVIVGQGS